MKLVTVIIPAYNKAELTVRTVESVLVQTYRDIEIIVVDDGSTDNTERELKPYADSGKIRYFLKDNGGACSARNIGIREARGDYLAFLDCDDLYLPVKIEKSVAYLEKHPDLGLVHNPSYLIDEKDEVIGTYFFPLSFYEGKIFEKLISWPFICNSTIVAKKECFEQVGVFDESIFMPADWDMWLRISERYKIGYVKEFLTKYRKESGYILKHLEKRVQEEEYVINRIFDRRSDLNAKLKDEAISNMYFRNANGALSIKNIENSQRDLVLSIEKNPLNLKARFLYMLIKIFGENVQWVLGYIGLCTSVKKIALRSLFIRS